MVRYSPMKPTSKSALLNTPQGIWRKVPAEREMQALKQDKRRNPLSWEPGEEQGMVSNCLHVFLVTVSHELNQDHPKDEFSHSVRAGTKPCGSVWPADTLPLFRRGCGFGFGGFWSQSIAHALGAPSPPLRVASVKRHHSDEHNYIHSRRKLAFLQQQLSSQLTSPCHKSLLTGAHNYYREKLFPLVAIPVKYTDS